MNYDFSAIVDLKMKLLCVILFCYHEYLALNQRVMHSELPPLNYVHIEGRPNIMSLNESWVLKTLFSLTFYC